MSYYRYGYWYNYYDSTPNRKGIGVDEKNFHKEFQDVFRHPPTHTEIRRQVGSKMYGRGVDYQQMKSIKHFKFTSNTELKAKCESLSGNSSSSYNLVVNFEEDGDETYITDSKKKKKFSWIFFSQ